MIGTGKIDWVYFDPEDKTTWPGISMDIVFLTLLSGKAEFHRGYMGWSTTFYEVLGKRVRKDGSVYVTKRKAFEPKGCDEIVWAAIGVPDWWTPRGVKS